jgi:glycosyltransferase involved in cell wall biosynthesis
MLKKLLIICNSPMPEDICENRPAAGIRSYQFLKACTGKYEIKCVAIEMAPVEKAFDETIVRIGKENFAQVQNVHDEFKPDLILGVNTYPSYVACGLHTEAPIWADLNGWIMAEAQAQAYKIGGDSFLPHYFEYEKRILARADKFSAVSHRQADAILGSLAWAGRLNNANFGTEMVCTIPNWTEDFLSDKNGVDHGALAKIPSGKFNLLWLGGYNTWVDEELLFKGIEKAMNEIPDLHFVSTGGAISGLDDKTFARFLEMVNASRFKDRFVFLGWVKTDEIPLIYGACNVGLNIDRACVETHTGARNRINEMMKFSLPVITTLGSEIAGECVRVGAGIGIGRDDYMGSGKGGARGEGVALEFTGAIASAYGLWRDGGLKEMGGKGRAYIIEECSFEKVCEPFLNWEGVRSGGASSLGSNGMVDVGISKVKAGVEYFKMNGAKKFFEKAKGKILRK